jgi:hypothetical protein
MLKKIMTGTVALATMFTSATTVTAGGLSDELMEPVVENVIEDDAVAAAGSAAAWLIPALIVGALILVATSGGDDEPDPKESCGDC